LIIVKKRTKPNVPSILAGGFGEKGIIVRIEMIKKYTFAALLNCKRRESGAHVKIVNLVVRTELFHFLLFFAN
jgi:hypothetical protein